MNVFRKPQEKERNPQASLYVGNLDVQVTENLLYELFIQVGPVKQLNLPKDRILRAHQGFGFVEFKTIEDAEYAMKILRGVRLFGRTLKINKIETSSASKTSTAEFMPAMSVGARVFIGNLNTLADSQYLKETFSSFGEILGDPEVVHDEKGTSHAFVEFGDFESSDSAIEKLNGATLMNNKVRLSYAYKEGMEGKKIQHGDQAERQLAKQAQLNITKNNKGNRKGKN